eukprot:TRINITY_DN3866_c0_g3_i3.p1 TRINITY_DN3866_c0_g3~~TRINITY_DN3866_c0_g3_i3.p1  ORF type:complete len:1484 (+),score=339.77 TRINITY_DN3866_c0_g3_i3:25-4452(+)
MAPWTKFLARNQENTAVAAAKRMEVTRIQPALEGTDALAADAQSRIVAVPGGDGIALPPQRKMPTVVEMIEYVRGLGIDAVNEDSMLWIAEEALHAPLPPGWSEHQDEKGVIYFHNSITGQSSWRHPMDEVFRDIVSYQRRVTADGGFWNVEDDLAEIEERIRKDLQAWMELYDEYGEKFYYNKNSEESRFDDPRMGVYHTLYARIKMVAKMKERMPEEARAQKPPEPTEEELEQQRLKKEQDMAYLRKVVLIQSFVRQALARKRRRLQLAQGVISKGPQPLKGQMLLKMEKVGKYGGKDLVLRQTTPHRRNRAASKLQARVRGILVRKKFRALVLHRAHLGRLVTRIQATARVWLAIRRCRRIRRQREDHGAVTIQRRWRGFKDRRYANVLRQEKERFDWTMKCVLKIQSGFRMALAMRRCRAMQHKIWSDATLELQRRAKVYSARRIIAKRIAALDNVQVSFQLTPDSRARRIFPWTLSVKAAPWDPASERPPDEEGEGEAAGYHNLFWREAADQFEDRAALRIQTAGHGMLARKRVRNLRDCCATVVDKCVEDAVDLSIQREASVKRIQNAWRGKRLLRLDLIKKKMWIYLKKQGPAVGVLQAHFQQYTAQRWLKYIMVEGGRENAALLIQSNWRGYIARRHADGMRMETLWPLKSFFEYTATGPDFVRVDMKLRPNPFFLAEKFYETHGWPKEEEDEPAKPPARPALFAVNVPARDDSSEVKEGTKMKPPTAPSGRRSRPQSRTTSRQPSTERESEVPTSARPRSKPPGSRSGSRGLPPPLPKSSPAPSELVSPAAPPAAAPAAEIPSLPAAESAAPAASPVQAPAPAPAEVVAPSPAEAPAPKAEAAPATKAEAVPAPKAEAAPAPAAEAAPATKAEATPASKAETEPAPEAEAVPATKAEAVPAPKAEAAPASKAEAAPPAEAAPAPTPAAAPEAAPAAGAEAVKAESVKPEQDINDFLFGGDDDDDIVEEASERASEADSGSQKKGGKSRSPLVPEAPPSLAQEVLRKATLQYEDIRVHKGEVKKPQAPSPPVHEASPQPAPPAEETRAVGDIQASGIRGAAASEGAAPSKPRKSYAGKVEGGKFTKTNLNLDSMSEKQKQTILKDIESNRQQKEQLMEKKRAKLERQKERTAANVLEQYQAQCSEAEQMSAERSDRKAEAMEKWMKEKKAESKKKKRREEKMLAELRDKETQKAEQAQKLEEGRMLERERRLRIAHQQKSFIEMQLAASKAMRSSKQMGMSLDDRMTAPGFMPQMQFLPGLSGMPGTMPMGMFPGAAPHGMPGMMPATMPRGMMMPPGAFPGMQSGMPGMTHSGAFGPGGAGVSPEMAARMLHRHVHHHLHYHDGEEGDEGGPPELAGLSPEEQQQLEAASEARIKAKLEPGFNMGQPFGRDMVVDNFAATPTRKRSSSMGMLPPDMTKTQEAFKRHPSLPQLDPRGSGLKMFQRGYQRAFDSYCDNGRPRFVQRSA